MDSLPQSGDCSDEIIEFAIANRNAIIDRIMSDTELFYRHMSILDMLPKYLAGRQEHGPLSPESVMEQDWIMHGDEEKTDLFWYKALEMYSDTLQHGEK